MTTDREERAGSETAGRARPSASRPASTRRELAALTGAALALVVAPASASPTRRSGTVRNGRAVMVLDLARCTGCQACAVACKAEHGVRLGGFRSWVSEEEVGRYPEVTREFLPRLCNHCKNPACEKVCPTGATFKRADGVVTVDADRCIGCRHCMAACPYNARYFNSQRDPEGMEKRFPARTHGTVDKCDFCSRRIDAGERPACVATCPAGARAFGDADNPHSEVFAAVSSGQGAALLPDLGTEPSVFYLGGRPELFRCV